MKSGVMEEVKLLYKPEFINRIDEIMVFHPLNHEEMLQIVDLLAAQFEKRCKEQMGIDLKMSSALKAYLVDHYADAKMGARPLKRAMQSMIEDEMALALLNGTIAAKEAVKADLKDGKAVFSPVKKKQTGRTKKVKQLKG